MIQEVLQGCDLCSPDRLTPWYYDHPNFKIIVCKTCNNPMVVWAEHTMVVPRQDQYDGYEALSRVADRIYGYGGWQLDRQQRTIFDHQHWHARPR